MALSEKAHQAIDEVASLVRHLDAVGKPDDHVIVYYEQEERWRGNLRLGHLREVLALANEAKEAEVWFDGIKAVQDANR